VSGEVRRRVVKIELGGGDDVKLKISLPLPRSVSRTVMHRIMNKISTSGVIDTVWLRFPILLPFNNQDSRHLPVLFDDTNPPYIVPDTPSPPFRSARGEILSKTRSLRHFIAALTFSKRKGRGSL